MKHWNRKYINKSFTFSLFILFISKLCLSSAIAAPLVDGQSILISEATSGMEAQYHIDISPGTTSLQLDISGGTGDADMYVSFEQMPTTSTYDCRPWVNGNEETCQFDNPSAGRWYVMIRAYNPYSGVTLSASANGEASSEAPTALSPTGTITTNQPTFTWTAVSGTNLYAVYAKDATGKLQVWNVARADHAGCASGTCSYTHPTAVFAEGSGGFWKVMTVDDGYGPESNPLYFTVNTQQSSENELSPDGQPITISQSVEDAEDQYFVDVSSGASLLTVQMNGGTGDADMYVRFGAKPTTSTYDCRPYKNGNNETCQFDNPSEGRWYVMVRAYNPYSGVNLSATVETEGTGCDMSIDTDGDRLPDCYETNTGHFVSMMDTGTDPAKADTDGDAIPDGDEVLGTQGDLDLPGMGVSPVHKDLLVEYDWFEDSRGNCGFHSHQPTEEIVNRVSDGFAMAPADSINNPDGKPGINVIHDYGQGGLFTGGNFIEDDDGIIDGVPDSNNQQSGIYFEELKNANFDNNRRGYFHRVLLGHTYINPDGEETTSSGRGELPGDDTIVSIGCGNFHPNVSLVETVANTIMHELGHNLGLRHGGDEHLNRKPNYNSVMNYRFQFPGVDAESSCDAQPDGILSYSSGDRLTLDEKNLDESKGVCGDIAIDFNGSGAIDFDFLVQAEINIIESFSQRDDFIEWTGVGNENLTVLHDYNDWENLDFISRILSSTDGDISETTWESCQEMPGSN